MKLDASKIIIEARAIESEEEEYDPKNQQSSDEDDTISYAGRRDSQKSTSSDSSNASSTDSDTSKTTNEDKTELEEKDEINELSDQLNSTLKVDESVGQVESLTEKLRLELKVVGEDDLQDRSPMRADPNVFCRDRENPYDAQNRRNANHFSGGYVQQQNNSLMNINENYVQPNEVNLNNELLPQLSADIVSDFFNNLTPTETAYLNSALYLTETADLYPAQSSTESFTTRQSTPTFSSPDSTPSHQSCSSEAFSPLSFTTDSSQPLGSPNNSVYELPSASGISLASNSPARTYELPSTLPNTSEDEDDNNNTATTELRTLIDTELKEPKKHEWISASTKEEEVLLSDLSKLLCIDTRFTDRKLVRIYAIITIIMKQGGHLKKFFVTNTKVLSSVALKNNPLLLRYIVEIMQNLHLNPVIGESPTSILNKVIAQNQDMREMLKTLLALKTANNLPMFDLNEIDEKGLTPIHRVLRKIKDMEDQEMKNLALDYLQICLEHRPDFSLTTLPDNRTYLHHAVSWRCGVSAVGLILRYCGAQSPSFALANQQDSKGYCALRLAENISESLEVLELLGMHSVFNMYPNEPEQYSVRLLYS